MERSSGNSSFIPKRGTSSRRRKVRGRSVHIITLSSYIVLFAVLVASAAMYAYSQFIGQQLQGEIAAMNEAVEDFNEADMQKVLQFDNRLRQAEQRLDNSVSVAAILTALEQATVNIVRFDNVSVTRNYDEDFFVEGSMEAGAFSTTEFQREIFKGSDVVEAVEITELDLLSNISEESGSSQQTIQFTAKLAVPVAAIPYRPVSSIQIEEVPVVTPAEQVEAGVEEIEAIEEPIADEIIEDSV